MNIELQKMVNDSHIPTKKLMRTWLSAAISQLPQKLIAHQNNIVIRIISREESAELNTKHRHKTGPTNVLAFEDHPLGGLEPDTLGDLAICADLVKQEAETQGKSINAHWAHLIIHGFLHLIGYDHIDTADAIIMETLEVQILQKLGFPNPYADQDT